MRWSGASRGRPAEFRSTMETGARRGKAESSVGNSGAVVLSCALWKFLKIIERIIRRGECWKRVGFSRSWTVEDSHRLKRPSNGHAVSEVEEDWGTSFSFSHSNLHVSLNLSSSPPPLTKGSHSKAIQENNYR